MACMIEGSVVEECLDEEDVKGMSGATTKIYAVVLEVWFMCTKQIGRYVYEI